MKKYYIGILIVALVSLGVSGLVISKAVAGRQDKITERKVREVVTAFNEYKADNNGKIPKTLDDLNVDDIPSTITYTENSNGTYEFCAEFNEATSFSSYGDPSSVIFGSALQSTGQGSSYYDDFYDDDYETYSLRNFYTHKAGKNCQTVKERVRSSIFDDYDYNSLPSDYQLFDRSLTN